MTFFDLVFYSGQLSSYIADCPFDRLLLPLPFRLIVIAGSHVSTADSSLLTQQRVLVQGAVEAGDLVVSLGTSGTLFCPSETPILDVQGRIAPFCDATGTPCWRCIALPLFVLHCLGLPCQWLCWHSVLAPVRLQALCVSVSCARIHFYTRIGSDRGNIQSTIKYCTEIERRRTANPCSTLLSRGRWGPVVPNKSPRTPSKCCFKVGVLQRSA